VHLRVSTAVALSIGLASSASAETTFSRDVAPILFRHCASCHHPDGAGPFSVLTYPEARRHAAQIAELTASRAMPPRKAEPGYGEFVGQERLTDGEIAAIQRWVADGALEGDPREVPVPPVPIVGWQLGKPDLVVRPPPYTLHTEGTDVFRIFVIPIPTASVRYVRGLEFRPGNRAVHHANIRIDRTPASRRFDDEDPVPGYDGLIAHSATYPDGHFLGWTPGQAAPLLPKGLAWRLEPHTDLVVELHMQPTGKPEVIQPSIGLFFGSDPPERTPAMLRLGRQNIAIGAGEKNYRVTDSFVLPVDVEVQAVQPHAHYLLREAKGIARLPDGSTRPLIYIKDWDFRWQQVYRYAVPTSLPKGTTLAMEYTYDNSADNARNPSRPPQPVHWGQRSKDEMGDLWIQVLTRDERDLAALNAQFRPKVIAEDIIGYERRILDEPGTAALHDDVALLYLALERAAEAAAHFEASLRMTPDSAASHFNLATALTFAGRIDEAIGHYERALAINPDYALAHNNLGAILFRRGQTAAALEHLTASVRFDPANAEAHDNLGRLYQEQRRIREAVAQFREAVTLRPDWASPVAELAWLLATARDDTVRRPEEAIVLGERAVFLTDRRDQIALDVLAAAYAAAGNFVRALELADAALRLAPDGPAAAAIRQRQALYKEGIPARSPQL
jgi:tetratricopeptide (TPR) repeat protein